MSINNPHIIALDMDGTLLNSNKKITRTTKDVLSMLRAAGHIVVICTGRSLRASIDVYHELQLDTPIVNVNGAHIPHPKNMDWLPIHHPIPLEVAYDIIETCYETNATNLFAEVIDGFYMERYDDSISHIYTSYLQETPCHIGNVRASLKEAPISMIVHLKPEKSQPFMHYLLDNKVVQYRVLEEPFNIIEITKEGINKASGLRKVAEYFQIPQEQIIAFGDESNDLEMLQYAGVGVAMGNAYEDLKMVADHVTASNDQDGIAVFLQKYFDIATV